MKKAPKAPALAERIDKVQQVVRNAIAQTMGASYHPASAESPNGDIAPIDTWKIADVGKDMLDMQKTDVFTKVLALQIAAYIMDNRLFTNDDLPPVYKTAMEYGGYILKVRLGLYSVDDDPMWSITDGTDYSSDEHTPVLPTTYAKLFDELKPLRVKWTVYNDTLAESMTSWDMMAAYISAMEVTVQNTIALAMRVITKQIINAGIAISDKATKTARHLLTEAKANGLLTESATAADFYASDKCIEYAINQMILTRDYMREYTSAFNNKSAPTFTPDDADNFVILSAFERLVAKTTASIYHDNKMDLKDYYKINWWQAVKDGSTETEKIGDIETTSTVMISADANNKLGIGTEAYTAKNVIGFIYDDYAIGVAERTANKTTSSYTACADFWNMFTHIALNAWVDSGYNMVAFIVD